MAKNKPPMIKVVKIILHRFWNFEKTKIYITGIKYSYKGMNFYYRFDLCKI